MSTEADRTFVINTTLLSSQGNTNVSTEADRTFEINKVSNYSLIDGIRLKIKREGIVLKHIMI